MLPKNDRASLTPPFFVSVRMSTRSWRRPSVALPHAVATGTIKHGPKENGEGKATVLDAGAGHVWLTK